MNIRPVITLLTDFGTSDGYVAAMKGVLLSHAPNARILDACHHVKPQDVKGGAWVLHQYSSVYPPGTLHVAVVDPGVGTDREGVVIKADGQWYIGPDNDLFALVTASAKECMTFRIRPEVHRPGQLSATFHGRDIFAYVAARLAADPASLFELTEACPSNDPSHKLSVSCSDLRIEAEIAYVDHFGNLITSVGRDALSSFGANLDIQCNDLSLGTLEHTYASVPMGHPLALINSSDFLELAIRGGSAAEAYHLVVGDPVIITRPVAVNA